MEAFVNARMDQYNSQPQTDLGGLSPAELHSVISGDWTAGPLTLDRALPHDALSVSDFYRVSRALLLKLRNDPVRLTQAGYLPGVLLRELAEAEGLLSREISEVILAARRISEGEILLIHLPRVTLDLAGLIGVRKGRLVTRPLGRELLDPGRAGELFARLFHAFFRTLNLEYAGQGPASPEFQQLIGYAIVRLREVAAEWVTVETLRAEAIHPALHLESLAGPTFDPVVWITGSRLVRPLVWFGLVAERFVPDQNTWPHEWQVRKTPLFDRFLRRSAPQASGPGPLRLV